jgi:hypothetical protein
MSYLDQPRINFTGRFFTNVSTINNDLANFDPSSPVGDPGWNPNGVALFKFDSCTVTGVQSDKDDGKLLGAAVTTPPQPVPGKLVDLDPDEQALSQVIGVVLNLSTASGAGFQGKLEPCNLQDMWRRAPQPSGNAGGSMASAIFLSTLNDVTWNNADQVGVLNQLCAATEGSQLAIRFCVSSYFFADPTDPESGFGVLVGSIGPYRKGDPVQFARRRLIPHALPQPTHDEFEANSPAPKKDPLPKLQFQACNFQLDKANYKLSIDLVNSIQVASFAGPPRPVGKLRAVIMNEDGSTEETLDNPFEFTNDTNKTHGGIVDVSLKPDQSTKLEKMRAGIQLQQAGGWTTILAEHPTGKFVNIAPFTMRTVGGGEVNVELRAFQWGQPLPNETLELSAEATQGSPESLVINNGSGSAVTNAEGIAAFVVKTPDTLDVPTPRQQLDSLVYVFTGPWTQLNGGLLAAQIQPAAVMVWEPYADAGIPNPTWEGQVQPIFDEYMRIYPGMKAILDLTDLAVVLANKEALLTVFSLPFDAPHRMPVTRDLSPQKIEVIKTWLSSQP